MIQGLSEIAAMCIGLMGMIGASATTGLPMWKVTVSTGENETEMETRWEGLWMNCHRDTNIRMQCKVYDSLLDISPELQAGRGLMCCSIALSGVGLLVALAGMRCTSCFQGIKWAKTVILMVAGGIQFMGCICVFVPVSWTGYVIVRDLHNPLSTNTERREVGDALYIGWATGAFLLASALLFTCRCLASDGKLTMTSYYPVSTLKSTRNSQRNKTLDAQLPIPLQTAAQDMMSSEAQMNRSACSQKAGNIHISGNSLYATQNTSSFSGMCDPVAYNCYY
ncbi:PREDICTED: claudin-8-like [Cyprinodon variegatus]|uniref:Claudin 8.3 n=1 Tax=Cyprinodon variegatus TaxID=28743 RepID=A0A3Q2CQ36_CYPVA|nr:PREDICTED: claudin-8-like [Cyprinodon variegatus]